MKKKLSFLLALVFIFTLAFSVIPGAGATYGPPPPPQPEAQTLTVKKAVAGNNASQTEKFSINVKFILGSTGSLADIGNDAGITPVDGIYTLSLHHNEKVVFSKIPVGTLYEVTENDLTTAQTEAGWSKGLIDYDDSYGAIAIDDASDYDSVTVNNIYTEPPFGTLTITKDVTTENAPVTGVKFPISIQFTLPEGADPALYLGIKNSGDADGVVLTATDNGAYLFRLTDGASITFSKIPVGTIYTVTEDFSLSMSSEDAAKWALEGFDDNDYGKGDVADNGIDKIKEAGDCNTLTVFNKYMLGILKVSKDVTTENAPTGVQFPITVTFTSDSGLDGITTSPSVTPDTENAGKYVLNLADDASVMFYGIPVGTTYTVDETLTTDQVNAGWANNGFDEGYTGYQSYKNDGNGDIGGTGDNDIVKVLNKYTKGILTVTKDVLTAPAPSGVLFPITVTFKDAQDYSGITTSPNVVPTTPGTYTFTLTDNTSITFYGIPVGATYTVSEPMTDPQKDAGWRFDDVEYSSDKVSHGYSNYWSKQKIDCQGDSDTAVVENKFCWPKTGTLTIQKEVAEDTVKGYLDSLEFTVNVAFSHDNPFMYLGGIKIGNTPVTFNTGTTTVELKLTIGQSVEFKDVPVGTKYVVTETNLDANWAAPTIVSDDSYGVKDIIDNEGDPDVVIVTNKYDPKATLEVTKAITGTGASSDVPFSIDVTFYGDVDLTGLLLNGSPVVFNTDTTTVTITLTGGDTATFTRIPLGASYSVMESTSLPANWSYVSGNVLPETKGASLNIENLSDTVTITNNFTPPPTPIDTTEYGTLKVDKVVNTGADGTVPFAIKVNFTATSWNVSGIANDTGLPVNGSGEYTFTLTADAPAVTFSNIPTGTTYTVIEVIDPIAQSGWTEGASTGKTGTISTTPSLATIANVYAAGVLSENTTGSQGDNNESAQGVESAFDSPLPQTGGVSPSTLLGIFGLALIAIGGTAFTVFRKKNTGKSK